MQWSVSLIDTWIVCLNEAMNLANGTLWMGSMWWVPFEASEKWLEDTLKRVKFYLSWWFMCMVGVGVSPCELGISMTLLYVYIGWWPFGLPAAVLVYGIKRKACFLLINPDTLFLSSPLPTVILSKGGIKPSNRADWLFSGESSLFQRLSHL